MREERGSILPRVDEDDGWLWLALLGAKEGWIARAGVAGARGIVEGLHIVSRQCEVEDRYPGLGTWGRVPWW